MADVCIKVLRILLLCISCYGWGAYFVHEKKIKVEFALSLLISAIGSAMFLAGILNVLMEVSVAIFAFGLLLAIGSLVKRQDILKMLTPGTVVFLLMLVFLTVLLYGTKVTTYDNFSHWAVVMRIMLRDGRLPNIQDELIMFQSYPTGSASFIYYICTITGIGKEWMMLYAQGVAIVASVIPIFAFAKRKAGVVLGIATVLLFLCANIRIMELHVDTLLTAVAIGGFLFCLYYKEQISMYYWAILSSLIFLISIKNSGVFFALVIVVYCACFTKGERIQKALVLGTGSYGALLVWQKHVKSVFEEGMVSKHSLSIEYFESVFGDKTKEQISEIFHNYLEAVFQIRNEFLFFLILAVILLLVSRVAKGSHFADIRKKVLFYIGVYVIYQISLFGMYMFSMPTSEAVVLASYDRYHMTMVSFLVVVLMVEYMHLQWQNKRVAIGVLGLALGVEIMAMSPDFTQLTRKKWEDTERYKLESVVEKYNVPRDGSYMFLMDEADAGYTYYFYRYYFETVDVGVYYEEQIPHLKDQWKHYKYLIVIDDTEINRDYINNVLDIDSQENFIVLDQWKNQ